MDDLNISINPELLDEKGVAINEQFKIIDDAINEIESAQSLLASWHSVNKDKYETKVKDVLPKMKEMADTINSYGNVARVTGRAIINTEKIISDSIDASA